MFDFISYQTFSKCVFSGFNKWMFTWYHIDFHSGMWYKVYVAFTSTVFTPSSPNFSSPSQRVITHRGHQNQEKGHQKVERQTLKLAVAKTLPVSCHMDKELMQIICITIIIIYSLELQKVKALEWCGEWVNHLIHSQNGKKKYIWVLLHLCKCEYLLSYAFGAIMITFSACANANSLKTECVVPENIHTPPTEDFLFCTPLPPQEIPVLAF